MGYYIGGLKNILIATTMGHYLFQVTKHDIHELVSNQEETDSRVVLYLKYAVKLGYKSAVVRTPDGDILFILLYFAHVISPTIFLDVGTGKHCQIVNVSELAELKGYWLLHCGLDSTYLREKTLPVQYVKGKAKVGPLKKVPNYPKYHGAFRYYLSV